MRTHPFLPFFLALLLALPSLGFWSQAILDAIDRDAVEMLYDQPRFQLMEIHSAWTLLHQAAFVGALQTVSFLIEAGFDVNARDGNGFTPLMLAIRGGWYGVVTRLIYAGATTG